MVTAELPMVQALVDQLEAAVAAHSNVSKPRAPRHLFPLLRPSPKALPPPECLVEAQHSRVLPALNDLWVPGPLPSPLHL